MFEKRTIFYGPIHFQLLMIFICLLIAASKVFVKSFLTKIDDDFWFEKELILRRAKWLVYK